MGNPAMLGSSNYAGKHASAAILVRSPGADKNQNPIFEMASKVIGRPSPLDLETWKASKKNRKLHPRS